VPPTAKADVEADLRLATFVSECQYGAARLELEASFVVEEDGAGTVIQSAGPAGDAFAQVFTGLCTARVGEGGFRVEPVATLTTPAAPGAVR
jgi:hypothetical protein